MIGPRYTSLHALIEAGADLNAFARPAGTPLVVSIGRRQQEVARLLAVRKSAADEWAPQEKATARAIAKTLGPPAFATEIETLVPISTGHRVALSVARVLWTPIILSVALVHHLRTWVRARINSMG